MSERRQGGDYHPIPGPGGPGWRLDAGEEAVETAGRTRRSNGVLGSKDPRKLQTNPRLVFPPATPTSGCYHSSSRASNRTHSGTGTSTEVAAINIPSHVPRNRPSFPTPGRLFSNAKRLPKGRTGGEAPRARDGGRSEASRKREREREKKRQIRRREGKRGLMKAER